MFETHTDSNGSCQTAQSQVDVISQDSVRTHLTPIIAINDTAKTQFDAANNDLLGQITNA